MTFLDRLTVNRARHITCLAFMFLAISFLLTGCEKIFDDTGEKDETTAKVIKVKDGDSVILQYSNGDQQESRIHGIDAPEYNQPFGKESKNLLSKMVLGESLRVKVLLRDKYKRDLVVMFPKSSMVSVNQSLVEQGAAWVFRQKTPQWDSEKKLLELQEKAKKNEVGLWGLPRPLAPWEWRERYKN